MNEVKVRFPNESFPIEIPNFKWEEFKTDKVFNNEVFGWWGDVYVGIAREDWNERYENGYKEKGNEFYK
tara:strand:- start:68738 stop:68944 length:207 start_codon:yes stop_codon:yes gene_type:complete